MPHMVANASRISRRSHAHRKHFQALYLRDRMTDGYPHSHLLRVISTGPPRVHAPRDRPVLDEYAGQTCIDRICAPPSTTTVWPVIHDAFGPARKPISSATSAGSPIRP